MAGPSATLSFAQQHLSPGIGRMSNLVIRSGKGSWVTTIEGKKYLDFTSGIGVTSTGHSHPKVVKAAQDQLENIIHCQVNITYNETQIKLTEKLLEILPKQMDRIFYWNSGAEAIEAAVKLARHATKKQNIIVFKGGYHGRTLGTMGMTTSKTIYRDGFGPLLPGIFVAPFPYCLHCPAGKLLKQQGNTSCCNDPLHEIKMLLKMQTSPAETAAVLIEPILGEGGYVVPPKDFLLGLKKICDENKILLIADEVQSGFGRTGKYFAVEHFGVVPDILVMAKGIASGLPLSAIAARSELMEKQPAGSMGGTYAGNAVSCAAGIATLEVFKEEKLLDNANARGAQLTQGLKRIATKFPQIAEIRGLGLMVGLEFDAKYGTANAVSKACLERNMLLLTAGVHECIRFVPALTVNEKEVNLALETFEGALKDVFK